MRISYLGPKGTFTQQAAAILLPMEKLEPRTNIDDVFSAVVSRECEAGVVPIENSTEGPVNATLDALLREDEISITALLDMPISHVIMGSKNAKRILANPQALAQCRGYIRREHPDAELVECASNGEAARIVAEAIKNNLAFNWAAIGPAAAAREYNLRIWAKRIQDISSNNTAFIQIEKKADKIISPGYRASIAFSAENRPGALYGMLSILDSHGINMTKILSRPIPGNRGEYMFFIDIDVENNKEEDVKSALAGMEKTAAKYKFLGLYPVLREGRLFVAKLKHQKG